MLVPLLENSQSFELHTYPSEEGMKHFLANGEVPELGLVIPAGFDQALQAGESPELQGYVLRWVDENQAAALQRAAETEIANLLGRPLKINLQGNRVDLKPDSDGLGVQASFGLAYVIIMIGIILVPHLMLEEKQSRTLDALSVSPAMPGHIVTGKALAGLLYCCLGGVVALAINRTLVVHWWLAILTVVLGSLFTVSLGLWLGIKIDSRAQLTMWSWVFLLPMIMPIIFSLLQGLIPDVWVRIFGLVPSSIVLNLARTSFANPIPIVDSLLKLAWVAVATGGVLVVVAWILRRRDREAGALSTSVSPSWMSSLQAPKRGSQGLVAPLLKTLPWLRSRQFLSASQPAFAGESTSREPGLRANLVIIRAIAAKDLLEALKNRLILSILLGSFFIMLSNAALPLLLRGENLPRMVVYDQGRSTILRGLTAREDFRLGIVETQEEMESALSGTPNLVLGLVLPANFDQQAGSGKTVQLEAYYPHWSNPDALSQQTAFFEEQLSLASWAPIHLDLAGHAAYPSVDLDGHPLLLSINLMAVMLVIGIALVPLLMIEEKETQTLKALLVSPANLTQVIVGKALVGLFYSLLPTLVVVLFYDYLFVHWGIAILAIILMAILAVGVGLLVGVISDSPTTASMWGSFILLFMIGSGLVKLFSGLRLPQSVQSALEWLPGSAMLQLIGISQAGEIPMSLLWQDVTALLAVIAVIAVLLTWRMRHLEA
jgi:ABC-type Na+ efflux pump permease subunit